MYPSLFVSNGKKYVGLIIHIKNMNAIGTMVKIFTISLEPLVRLFNSSLSFFLLNNDFSIDENTSTIFPPV